MPAITIGADRFEYDVDPDHCPICHHGIEPKQLQGNLINRDKSSDHFVQIIYRCPRRGCQHAFISTYQQEHIQGTFRTNGVFSLKYSSPYHPEETSVPEEVQKISPEYENLIRQSSTAEHYQLDQIAGVGYRKALEYLIKDFSIYKKPKDEERIKSAYLGKCIDTYIEDDNLKACAKRATWLGNDETHYVRRWEEKDIKDLKILIRLTESWILTNLLTEEYKTEMPEATP